MELNESKYSPLNRELKKLFTELTGIQLPKKGSEVIHLTKSSYENGLDDVIILKGPPEECEAIHRLLHVIEKTGSLDLINQLNTCEMYRYYTDENRVRQFADLQDLMVFYQNYLHGLDEDLEMNENKHLRESRYFYSEDYDYDEQPYDEDLVSEVAEEYQHMYDGTRASEHKIDRLLSAKYENGDFVAAVVDEIFNSYEGDNQESGPMFESNNLDNPTKDTTSVRDVHNQQAIDDHETAKENEKKVKKEISKSLPAEKKLDIEESYRYLEEELNDLEYDSYINTIVRYYGSTRSAVEGIFRFIQDYDGMGNLAEDLLVQLCDRIESFEDDLNEEFEPSEDKVEEIATYYEDNFNSTPEAVSDVITKVADFVGEEVANNVIEDLIQSLDEEPVDEVEE